MKTNINTILAVIVILSITLIPAIGKFELVDGLVPFLWVVIFFNRKQFVLKNLYFVLLAFCGYILFTILLNKGTIISDYFEIYKVAKFITIIAFFSTITVNIKKIFDPIFIGLVLFNLLHYFNILDFNYIIKTYYGGGIHIDYFGLDFNLQPGIKRMIGTMHNPNNNGVLFTFLAIIYLPLSSVNYKKYLPFFVAVTMIFLCQSRTAVATFVVVLITYFVVKRVNFKSIVGTILSVICSYALFLLITIGSLLRPMLDGNRSLNGRLESWKYFWEMIKQKPIFGYSPNKAFFYENNLFSESEYILYAWRYGFIGLMLYISLLLYLFLLGYKYRFLTTGTYLALFIVALTLTSVTNNPLSDQTILVFLAISIGILYKDIMVYNRSNL